MNTNFKFAIERIQEAFLIQLKTKPTNKYIVLYYAVKQSIINNDLPHDWLLPSTRVLAEELKLSRTTINKTYELLHLEKLILSKPGSGYWVNYVNSIQTKTTTNEAIAIFNERLYPKVTEKGLSYLKNISLINRLQNNSLAFRPGLPPIDVFPVNQWKKLLNAYWRHVKSSGLSYSHATGITELKKSICNYLNISRNIKCNHEQVVIVSGSLQSLYLITNTLIEKGDHVILEDPTFPNVHSIFKSIQSHILPVSLDDEGIDVNKMNSLASFKPKIVHTTPSNHYPLGIKMSLKRRKELLEWASRNKALIIENDYENEIANSFNSLPTIYSLDTEDRTIYMGTFNRLLHPSIRLGYMIVPKYLAKAVEALQEHSHRFIAPSIQVVMNQFIEKNYLFQHIKNITNTAEERLVLFINEFEKNNNTLYIERKEFCSLHIVAKFKNKVSEKDELKLIETLSEQGIVTFSLSKCYIGEKKQFGLILGYSAVRPNKFAQKVNQMKAFL